MRSKWIQADPGDPLSVYGVRSWWAHQAGSHGSFRCPGRRSPLVFTGFRVQSGYRGNMQPGGGEGGERSQRVAPPSSGAEATKFLISQTGSPRAAQCVEDI